MGANYIYMLVLLVFIAILKTDSQAEGHGFEPRYPLKRKSLVNRRLHGFLLRFVCSKSFVLKAES